MRLVNSSGISLQSRGATSWVYPQGPWERVHADFLEVNGKQYLLVVDAYSKWPDIHEMGTHATAAQTVEILRRIFSTHGLPRRFVTHNGPQFKSQEFETFMKLNGIRHQLSPPYNPATNGQAERMVQEVKKKSLESRHERRTIAHQISAFLLRYRTTPNTTTGKTLSDLLMKRTIRTRLSLLQPEPSKDIR